MKKSTLIYGIIGGLITGAAIVLPAYINPDLYDPTQAETGDSTQVVGYSIMFIASILTIHLGIRHFRNKDNNGFISFGKGFKAGALIVIITFVTYTLISGIGFYMAFPEWIDQYVTAQIEAIQNNPKLSATDKTTQIDQIKSFSDMPALALAAFEALPMLFFGLIVSVISAIILKNKKENSPAV